jgi:hypothetical protein
MARRPIRWTTVLLAGIAVLAVADRVYRLDSRSLWLDEILTAQTAHLGGLADIVAWCQAAINQMPFFYVFIWFLGHWGDDEVLLRLPAMIAGILGVLAVYLVGSRLLDTRAGLVAALLMAVSTYAAWYSQEARGYSLLMLVTTVQMYFAYQAVTRGRPGDWLGLSLVTSLNLYTHYLALLATAAVVTYVGGYLLARLLARSGRRLRIAVAAALVVLAAAAALSPSRALLRAAYLYLAGFAGHPLRTAALAIGVVLAVALLAGGAVLLWRRSERFRQRVDPAALRMLAGAIGAGTLTTLLYAPWLPALRIFISRPDQSVLRFDSSQAVSLGGVLSVLSRLGLSGLLLVAFLAGLGVLVVWLEGGRRPGAALLLSWLIVPLLITWLSVRGAIVAIDLRYFSVLFPAVPLVIAAAVEAIAQVARKRLPATWDSSLAGLRLPAASAASLVLVGLLLVQALPALAASYQVNKDDYRATARHLAAASPPGSVVLSLGNYSDWTVICLDYYFHELHASITVVEGAHLDSDVGARLAAGGGAVWGVVIFPSAAQLGLYSAAGAPAIDFTDVTGDISVLRDRESGLPSLEQAQDLLRWELPLDNRLSAPDGLLDVLTGRGQLGSSLVGPPPGQGWSLPRGAAVTDGLLRLAPLAANPEVSAVFSAPLPGAGDYAVFFEFSNGSLAGAQEVFAILDDSAGRAIATWPGGYGFQCVRSTGWHRSGFAFAAPPEATSFTLLLRATGRGSAEFRDVTLSPIESAG